MGKNKQLIKNLEIPIGISRSDVDAYARINYPLFSFKHLRDVSVKWCRDASFLPDFLFRLRKLSELGWKEIDKSFRHSFGMEKIDRKRLKPQLPAGVTPEVPLFAFRAVGDNRPFVGFREGKVFHVVFIETAFGDIYDH